ncbi:hypothetical protein Q6A26_03620 [Xanthomonas euvesicatoria pv. eucalypti]|uniref:hypothetical protein n=1 Tax=Lysobacteraceae TaxID=32033 RepID=UPI0013DCA1E6|nr:MULTISPECIES: hypothetical protein [Xanthomonadaceae]MDO7931565.1 hypothetical protein [Xanthomonas euvesicatoria pv. eucalypti]MDO7935708.1 hypothetical protein [Xanthomonas euvesicatoria pv. eucalypti]MDO7940093.1 hypothetical protein [Xanthomonas euvesicatoria pv. eucalypti]MDO7944554.1 hypothetical protein [Xanthomonas euvesicatoria pv. eucalypti]MDO7951957.1 hypothetical protein [Xanthomonas euvesicatoria pv. eucalypti]
MSPTTATPQSLSAGLQQLRQQLAAPFLNSETSPASNPISFARIRDAGVDAKDNLRNRFSARP